MTELTAVVLAAGRGRRLGTPKALLDLGGRPALARVLEALRAAGVDDLRLTLPADRLAAVAARVPLDGLSVVPVDDPDAGGQSASIRAGLAAAPLGGDGFVLLPLDVALVTARDVLALARAFADRDPHHAIVVPSVDGRRGHPAFFAAALAGEFLALPPDAPAHRVVRRDPRRVHHVVLDAPWLVRDIDTPEDLAWAEALCRRRAAAD